MGNRKANRQGKVAIVNEYAINEIGQISNFII